MLKWLFNSPPAIPAFKQCVPSRPFVPHLIRIAVPEDYEACKALYRANEAGFPSGYFDQFVEWLEAGSEMTLVGELNGQVVSCGAVSVYKRSKGALLTVGMVSPLHQREGFGTAMLLARLVALPTSSSNWIVSGLLVEGAASFYSRFGFSPRTSLTFADEKKASLYQVSISAHDMESAARTLGSADVRLDIPRKVIPSLSAPKVFRF